MWKILIVDDEPIILEGLSSLLNWGELGLELAASSTDGEAAAALLETRHIDILVTDIKMPGMDGLELLRRVKSRRPHIRCIVLSSYDDFHYVKEAAALGIENYLLKPVSTEELIATLENVSDKLESDLFRQIERNQEKNLLRDNVVYRWLSGDIGRKELENRADLLEIDLDQESYVAAVVKLGYGQSAGLGDEDRRLLRFAARNICGELVASGIGGFCVSDMNGDIAVLLQREKGQLDPESVLRLMHECVERLGELLGLDAFITVGTTQSNFRDVAASYAQAKSIQELLMLYGTRAVVRYEDAMRQRAAIAAFPRLRFDRLRGALADRDKSALAAFFEEAESVLREQSGHSLPYIRNAVTDLAVQLAAVMEEASPQQEQHPERHRETLLRIGELGTLDAMLYELKRLAEQAMDTLLHKDEGYSPIVRRVVAYVQARYADNLDVKQVAQAFKMNPVYLGQLFKKETGDPFTTFVNKIRLEEAKRLLRETNLKAHEIAEKVGYTNANYFPTVFRKYVGCTPSEYQQQSAQNGI